RHLGGVHARAAPAPAPLPAARGARAGLRPLRSDLARPAPAAALVRLPGLAAPVSLRPPALDRLRPVPARDRALLPPRRDRGALRRAAARAARDPREPRLLLDRDRRAIGPGGRDTHTSVAALRTGGEAAAETLPGAADARDVAAQLDLEAVLSARVKRGI